jgi:hypothetical protein
VCTCTIYVCTLYVCVLLSSYNVPTWLQEKYTKCGGSYCVHVYHLVLSPYNICREYSSMYVRVYTHESTHPHGLGTMIMLMGSSDMCMYELMQ